MRHTRLHLPAVLLILRALGEDFVRRVAVIPAFGDFLAVSQRRQRLSIDPALVAIVHAEQWNATVERVDDMVRRPPAHRIDSLNSHTRRSGGNDSKGRAKDELLTNGERNWRDDRRSRRHRN